MHLSPIPAKRRHHGFTLVELIVIIVILAILAGVAIPRFVNYGDRAWRAVANSTYQQFVDARQAYIFGIPSEIVGDEGRIIGGRIPGSMLSFLSYHTKSANTPLGFAQDWRDQNLMDPEGNVGFPSPDGLPNRVRLEFKNGLTMIVDYHPLTGTFTRQLSGPGSAD